MTRADAIARIESYFDDGGYFADLSRRIAIPTESQEIERRPDLHRYLTDEIGPSLDRLGFSTAVHANPDDPEEARMVAARAAIRELEEAAP